MRKVVYAMSVSLDGYIEARGGDLSWSYPDEELHRHFNVRESNIDLYLYGRRLYENMAAFWPTADENPSAPGYEAEYSRIWKSKPKIVFSRTLDSVAWNSRLFRGDIKEEVGRLKQEPGKDISVAGAGLASSFMQLNLIDEYQLYIHPVILGAGKAMFQQIQNRINLQLQETHVFRSGVVLLVYKKVE
ncbi:MAG: dihydrofolate reductase family protein [Ignavibacteriales bacterium]